MWIIIEITRADQSSGARNMIMVGRLCLLNKENIANRAKLKYFWCHIPYNDTVGTGMPTETESLTNRQSSTQPKPTQNSRVPDPHSHINYSNFKCCTLSANQLNIRKK